MNVCFCRRRGSKSAVAKKGRSSSGNHEICRVCHDDDFDVICDTLMAEATLRDVWDFMHGSKWDTYDLLYINCQHFVKGLYKHIKQIVGKRSCSDVFINPFTFTVNEDEDEEDSDDAEVLMYHPGSLKRVLFADTELGEYYDCCKVMADGWVQRSGGWTKTLSDAFELGCEPVPEHV